VCACVYVLQVKMSLDRDVKSAVSDNRVAIIQCVDLCILSPYLCQKRLLDPQDLEEVFSRLKQKRVMESFIDSLHTKGPDSYSRFAQCIRESASSDRHLGHKYMTSLIQGRAFTDNHTICLSAGYRERVLNCMPDMVNGINLPSLLPYMTKYELLTLQESNDVTTLTLFSILDTKGPTAYFLFAKCLHEETSHPRHRELYCLIQEEADKLEGEQRTTKRKNSTNPTDKFSDLTPPSPKRRVPEGLKMGEHLTGEEYNQRRFCFESYYHNGLWKKVDEEAMKCKDSKIPEIQAIGLLETALSWIFRRNESNVLHLIGQARSICQRIVNNNSIFLQGRCEYLLALLYRYLKDYKKAKSHVSEARSILFGVQPGEDTSFAFYCNGTITAECLASESSTHEVGKVECLFEQAIDHAKSCENMDILITHSHLQLTQMYLGTTHTQLQVTEDKGRIRRARDCIETLKRSYEHLDLRCKSLFHLSQSDLHRSSGEVHQAIESARQALYLASQGELPMEIEAAEIRLRHLRFCKTDHENPPVV